MKYTTSFTLLVAGLLGVLMPFAFAPYEIFPFAILVLAFLLNLWLQTPSLKKSFWLGYVFGLGMFGTGVYWVFTSIHLFGEVPAPFAALITLGMVGILALFPATVGYVLNRYFPLNTTAKCIYAFPAIWVLSEWVRSWFLSGFPWLFVGYSQTNSPLKGYAPVLSVYLVSLFVAMSSGLIVNAVMRYKQKNYRSLYTSLLALSLIWISGSLLSLIPWTRSEGEPISVALVQGNVPQTIKWSPEYLQLSIDRYVQLTKPLWGKADIIIWPESAIPATVQDEEALINALDQKAKENNTTLILGIPIQTDENQYYNAVVTLGSEKQVYLKRHLVPFGEYTPFSKILSHALNFMNIPIPDMIPGKRVQTPLTVGKTKILASICYEIAFPDLIRSKDKSINMLLVVTNDAWFGKSAAEPQHLQMAAMRALEFGKPVLFVSNDGITAVINPDGTTQIAAPQREAIVLKSVVQPRYGITPWLYNGMTPLLIILISFLFVAVRANKMAITTQEQKNPNNPPLLINE
jgi:apolipoprotein N-acyltransferase